MDLLVACLVVSSIVVLDSVSLAILIGITGEGKSDLVLLVFACDGPSSGSSLSSDDHALFWVRFLLILSAAPALKIAFS